MSINVMTWTVKFISQQIIHAVEWHHQANWGPISYPEFHKLFSFSGQKSDDWAQVVFNSNIIFTEQSAKRFHFCSALWLVVILNMAPAS